MKSNFEFQNFDSESKPISKSTFEKDFNNTDSSMNIYSSMALARFKVRIV